MCCFGGEYSPNENGTDIIEKGRYERCLKIENKKIGDITISLCF